MLRANWGMVWPVARRSLMGSLNISAIVLNCKSAMSAVPAASNSSISVLRAAMQSPSWAWLTTTMCGGTPGFAGAWMRAVRARVWSSTLFLRCVDVINLHLRNYFHHANALVAERHSSVELQEMLV